MEKNVSMLEAEASAYVSHFSPLLCLKLRRSFDKAKACVWQAFPAYSNVCEWGLFDVDRQSRSYSFEA